MEGWAMRKIVHIWVGHKGDTNLSGYLTLSRWGINPENYNIRKLVPYLKKELTNLWLVSNGTSVAGWTMPRKELLKYFWSKRPTSIRIKYSDGKTTAYEIKHPKELFYTLDRNFGDDHYTTKAA